MSIINSVLGLFLGNKYERDIKEISPYVEKIHVEFEKVKSLSNDELREVAEKMRADIRGSVKADEDEIIALKEKAEKGGDLQFHRQVRERNKC
jgi:preprotein translocase subunit SecA